LKPSECNRRYEDTTVLGFKNETFLLSYIIYLY